MLLKVENLFKKFDGTQVLNDVTLQVNEGEIMAIIGPNGAGKSVLFSLISGIHKPTSGRISFQEDNITSLKPHIISRKGIARTFQHTTLFNQLQVIDNLLIGFQTHARSGFWGTLFHTKQWKKDREKASAKVIEILNFIGLKKKANHIVSTLPPGEQRLLSIGIALACEPKMILLDEPTGGLIHEDTELITRLIRKINNAGITICLIEHKMRMVMGLAQRIIVLNYGYKIAEGTPKQIGKHPKVIEAYLGRKRNA